jgi:hypothetical protein
MKAVSLLRETTSKGGRERKKGRKKTQLKFSIYLKRSQQNGVRGQFQSTEGRRCQKASLALLNFFGGSLGWEGKAQKLHSGFWEAKGGVCGLTGIERLRNLAEEEDSPV